MQQSDGSQENRTTEKCRQISQVITVYLIDTLNIITVT